MRADRDKQRQGRHELHPLPHEDFPVRLPMGGRFVAAGQRQTDEGKEIHPVLLCQDPVAKQRGFLVGVYLGGFCHRRHPTGRIYWPDQLLEDLHPGERRHVDALPSDHRSAFERIVRIRGGLHLRQSQEQHGHGGSLPLQAHAGGRRHLQRMDVVGAGLRLCGRQPTRQHTDADRGGQPLPRGRNGRCKRIQRR